MSEQFEMFTPAAPAPAKKGKGKYAYYPAMKVISMILGIAAGLCLIAYAYIYTKQYMEQIGQYKSMGMDIPKQTMNVIYLQLGITFLAGIFPIIGAVLPNKAAKWSAILTAAPIFWGLTNSVPSLIIALVQKAPLSDMKEIIIMCAGGCLAFLSAIFIALTPSYRKSVPANDDFVGELEIDGLADAAEDVVEAEETVFEQSADVAEAVEDVAQEATETVEDAVADVAEAAEDVAQEAAEAVEDTVADVAEAVEDVAEEAAEAVEEATADVAEAVEEITEKEE